MINKETKGTYQVMTPDTKQMTRGQRIWERVRDARETHISLWRARLLTASYKETEGLPNQLRRARAFEKIVTEFPIYIDDEQLLVGDFAAWPSAAEWFPEFNLSWERREFNAGRYPYGLNDQEVAEFKEILDYWDKRNGRDALTACLSPEKRARLEECGEEGDAIYTGYAEMGGAKNWHCCDNEKVIKRGLLSLIEEVERERENASIVDTVTYNKRCLLEGAAIALKAGIRYAERYAELAREMAKKASPERKQELEKIADICTRVPAYPARTFHEAVQTLWFIHVLGNFDGFSHAMGLGRVDQFLYPYYKQDIDAGRLTREEAITILECFRSKASAWRNFAIVYGHAKGTGEVQFHNCTLAGQTREGKDATNELSYLWLEAAFRVRSPHPTLSIRWHDKISQDFAMRAAELNRLGLGYPAWFGDKGIVSYLLSSRMGATLEEARDYCMSGCVINVIPGKTPGTYPINIMMPRLFEITLYDGCNPVTGRQLGLKTGKFEDIKSYDEIYQAFLTQLKFFVAESAADINRARIFRAQTFPQVFRTALFDDCIKRGEDPHGGGPVYQNSSMYLIPIGIMDVVDCLAAIKKLVFEEGKITKQKLLEALGANFDGYEDIRRMLLAAPKYGNDDDYADSIAVDLYAQCVKIAESTDACYGGKWVVAPHTLGFHGMLGRKIGALPSGRLAGESTAEGGVSPCQGADTRGPTATINSAGKIDQLPIYTPLFNMKFHPSALATRDDLQNFLRMLKTYFDDYGGKHIQFNVVSKEILLDAQVNPENYKNLVVRVAGYSALWVELERTIQDEIIARATKTW